MRTIGNVAVSVGDDEVQLVFDIHLPDGMPGESGLTIIWFAGPGGGYTKEYFDLRHPGYEGYSQAEHHTARGHVVIAYDHLGVGRSSVPDHTGMPEVAHALAALVAEVGGRLRAGTLTELLAPMPAFVAMGMGQSMGGYIAIVAQARHACFEAIAVLGSSAIGLEVPKPPHRVGQPGLTLEDFRYAFHTEDTPEELVRLDMEDGYPQRTTAPSWGSLTIPSFAYAGPGGVTSRGFVAAEAAEITVPVFIAAAEREVIPDVRAEPGAYRACPDISLFVVPNMAHMHNFASTRVVLWDRLVLWAEMTAASRSGAGAGGKNIPIH